MSVTHEAALMLVAARGHPPPFPPTPSLALTNLSSWSYFGSFFLWESSTAAPVRCSSRLMGVLRTVLVMFSRFCKAQVCVCCVRSVQIEDRHMASTPHHSPACGTPPHPQLPSMAGPAPYPSISRECR